MKTKNIWDIGQTVRVGFLTLEVIAGPIATPGNYAADEFGLCSKDRSKFYRFVRKRGKGCTSWQPFPLFRSTWGKR